MDVVLAHPEGYEVMPEVAEVAKKQAAECGGKFTITNDMKEVSKDDIVYPKSWAPFAAMEKRTNLYAEGDSEWNQGFEKGNFLLRMQSKIGACVKKCADEAYKGR